MSYKKIPVYIEATTGQQILYTGERVKKLDDYINFMYDEEVIFCVQFYTASRDGDIILTPSAISEGMALAAYGDIDFTSATELMFLTAEDPENLDADGINDPGDWIDGGTADLTQGQISIRASSFNTRFLEALATMEQKVFYFVIHGIPAGKTSKTVLARFPALAINRPTIDEQTDPPSPPPVTEYATKVEVLAAVRSQIIVEYSIDAESWHGELDVANDLYQRFRHGSTGEPSPAQNIPYGATGAKGDPFSFDAVGLLAGRSTYDDEAANFTYLATDTGDVYYKLSATSADWSSAIPFAAADSLALKTDITAHNESGAAHPDIRDSLALKANTTDMTTALGNKVDKVEGKGLSTNDYDNTDKSKVDALGSMSAEDAADYRTAAEQDLIDAGKVNSNAAITGATKAKITYDSKGLVTAGADLEESDIPSISALKVTGLATVATSGSYNDLSNKPLDRETVPMSITGYAVEGYPVARMDDVYDSIEIYKNAVGLAVVEMTVRSADNTITGDIVLVPVVNGVDSDPVTIAVTASWAKVSFALEIPAGTLAFRRDHASASDTLKDGASVITAQVIEITYRSDIL